ncbi:MAG: rod shape-determining protein RodA [Opitutales bacterium]|nr:rod shape-determining protein RodA [Opitutales bacterium]
MMDPVAPGCMILLSAIGVAFIYSSQDYTGGQLWVKQLIWLGISLGAYILFSILHYKILLENALWIYIASIVLLLAVKSPLGTEIYGARRWIDLKFTTLQPSELAKMATLIMVARTLSRFTYQSFIDSVTALGLVMAITALPTLIIFLQPDLGSALMLPFMTFALLYSTGFSRKFFQVTALLALAAAAIVGVDLYRYDAFLNRNNLSALENRGQYEAHSWIPLKDYQRNRLMAFVAPERIDPQGLGVSWNVRQSLISVGTGGWAGKGWNDGTQAKLGYLPQAVAHNDFIFSVIAEEGGWIGSMLVIGLFAVLVFNGIRVSMIARDRFGQMLALGVSLTLFAHIFINIGMTLGIAPVTGLPLPFLSYGGTFLLSCFMLQAFQQSVYRHRERLV